MFSFSPSPRGRACRLFPLAVFVGVLAAAPMASANWWAGGRSDAWSDDNWYDDYGAIGNGDWFTPGVLTFALRH